MKWQKKKKKKEYPAVVMSLSYETELELDQSYSTLDTMTKVASSRSCVCWFTETVFAFPGQQYLTMRSWRSI